MSSLNDNPVQSSSLSDLKFLLTSISSLFQLQRGAWRYIGEHTTDPDLASLIRGPMKEAGQLLSMARDLLRKLIDLAEIKMKQLELEARSAGKEWLGSQTDTEKASNFAIARRVHCDYGMLIRKAWEDGLDTLPELQARFDVMQNTLEKPDVPKPIEELTLSLKPFIRAAAEINDRAWAFESRLVGILMTVDEGLAVATVAVTRGKHPEADKIAQERYGTSWLSDHGQK